jgi:hypothetical protein
MKNKKEKKEPISFYERILLVVVIVSGLIVITIGLALVLGFMGKNISTEILGLLPAILSIMIILVVPKHLVQSECKAYFENREYKQYFREEFASKDEVDRVDAHLSRMIAIHLHEKYPIWAIGWVFRSLKRYDRLPESNKIGKIYNDFLRSMHEIITVCREKIIGDIYDPNKNTTAKDIKNLIDNSTPVSFDKIRLVERAVKDIIDYLIYGRINDYKKIPEKSYYDILLLLTLLLKECEGDNMADYKNFDELAINICKISDYTQAEKNKDKGFFHNEIKKFFKHFDEATGKDKNGFYRHIFTKDTDQKYNIEKPLFDPQINDKIRDPYRYVKLI